MTSLREVPTHALRGLRDRILRGELTLPATDITIQSNELNRYTFLKEVTRKGAILMLDAILAEREDRRIDMVWTGPEAPASAARDTWAVLRDLIRSAKSHVLIAGYRFDDGVHFSKSCLARCEITALECSCL